jgi:hypothetical protein
VGVFLFPLPRRGDELLERGVLGFPAERAVKFFFAGDQDGGIAGAAGRDFAGNFAAGDFLGGVDNFEDGETAAVAYVEGFAGNSFDGFEGAEVGVGDVEDVNVIADAGAVGSEVVRAENFDVRNNALSRVENFGNEMGFDAMVLAAFCGSARGVEIAKCGVMETGVGAVVGEDFFEAEFGFAVGIDWILGMVFGDRNGVRFAIGGGSGRENKFFDAVASDGVEEIYAGGDISSVEGAGLTDGFGDQRFAGKMHDRIYFVLGKDFFDLRANAEVCTAENRFGWDGSGVPLLEIIERDDLEAAGEEDFRTDATDVARCSGY